MSLLSDAGRCGPVGVGSRVVGEVTDLHGFVHGRGLSTFVVPDASPRSKRCVPGR